MLNPASAKGIQGKLKYRTKEKKTQRDGRKEAVGWRAKESWNCQAWETPVSQPPAYILTLTFPQEMLD